MDSPSIVALFPGQGSQKVGMAKDLYEQFGFVRHRFEEASDLLKIDLKQLCFESAESELALTMNTQPTLLLASTVAFEVGKREKGLMPSMALGHSLGEYSALVAAGSITFASAIQMVRNRGIYMQEAVPPGVGGMAAVLGMDECSLKKMCQDISSSSSFILEPANYNSDGQTVVAGHLAAIELLENKTEKMTKIIRLAVSAPFHCKMMEPARLKLASYLSKLESSAHPKMPLFPVIANCNAMPVTQASEVFQLLEKQMDHPVLWRQSVEEASRLLFSKNPEHKLHFIEYGPGKVLQGLVKRNLKTSMDRIQLSGLGNLEDLREFK